MKKILKITTLMMVLFLASCGSVLNIKDYTVDGTGLDWSRNPVKVLEPSRVKPNIVIPISDSGVELSLTNKPEAKKKVSRTK